MGLRWLLGLGALLPLAAAMEPMELPQGAFSLSTVDSSRKNSGGASLAAPTIGLINYSPIAPNKGRHLASAAAGIRAVNATALANQQPRSIQTAFTGQDTFTQALGNYITYKGGKVFPAGTTMNVYLIFYGAKWSRKQRRIVQAFVNSLDVKNAGGLKKYPTVAGWWAINSKYYHDKNKKNITSSLRLAGVVNDRGSMAPFGTKQQPFRLQHLQTIVAKHVDTTGRKVPPKGKLPLDVNGAYAVITADDVYAAEFCQGLCAFHTFGLIGGQKLAWTFVGNPAVQCPTYCTYRYFDPMYQPPNGDLGADAVCDKLGHELAEIATNTLPQPNGVQGWTVGNSVVENADLCEWEYGNVVFERDMTVWNMRGINNQRFLIQLNFDRVNKKCALQG